MQPFDVSLPPRVDATTSGDVRYALAVALDSVHEGDLTVDASMVESLDVAGLGVLVAAHRKARQRGVRLVICDPNRGCCESWPSPAFTGCSTSTGCTPPSGTRWVDALSLPASRCPLR
jgi:hypothetical protein